MNKPNIERHQLLKEEFQAKLEERFNAEADKESRSEDPELHWQCLKSILQEKTAEGALQVTQPGRIENGLMKMTLRFKSFSS